MIQQYDTDYARFFGIATGVFLYTVLNRHGDAIKKPELINYFGFSEKDIRNARKILSEYGILTETNHKRLGISYHIDENILEKVLNGEVKRQEKEPPVTRIIAAAFNKVELPAPFLAGGNIGMAQSLLKKYSADEIAGCWRDIVHGNYRTTLLPYLSFIFLARHPNILDDWKKWREGKKSLRPGETELDSEKFSKNAGF